MKKNNKLFVFLFLSILMTYSCSKKYKATALPSRQLHFGQGGGYTGSTTDYIVLENGQIFMRDAVQKVYRAHGNMKKSVAKDFFKQAVAFSNTTLNRPANFYQYIDLREDTTKSNRLVFSGGIKVDSVTNALLRLHETMLKAVGIEHMEK